MAIIEARELTKFYGKARGVDHLNLSVDEGEFFGFIGPNGAGKSTFIRILLGLIKQSSGDVRVLGLPPSAKQSYLADIGYMPSEAVFYRGMRVSELIAYSAKLRRCDCSAESARLCDRLELDTTKRVEDLSLGNRKKVSVVCALQHHPKLCILDEPTSGLDPLMQKEFFDLLRERNKHGTTVFFSSHILSEVRHNCTRAAIIRDGCVTALDSIENLSRTNTKKVVLRGIVEPPPGLTVKSVISTNDSVSFLYQGEPRELIGALYRLPVTDISIAEPELEEIFYHYYVKENGR